jgi:hypothetical protein
VSHALACPPRHTSSTTRHAATLAWAQAATPALNCTPRQMLEALDTPPPSHPFVDAVRAFLDRTPRWSGPAADLLKLLPLCKTPRVLSKQLRESILPLADAGIDVQFRRLSGGARVIDLFASQNPSPPPQPPPEQELTPTQEIPPPPGLCVTTPAAQSPHPPPFVGAWQPGRPLHGIVATRRTCGIGIGCATIPFTPPRATTKRNSDT